MANLVIEINSGSTTCCDQDTKKFCKFFGTMRFGTIPLCMLFPDDDRNESFTELKIKDNCVQRCKSCMEAAENSMMTARML